MTTVYSNKIDYNRTLYVPQPFDFKITHPLTSENVNNIFTITGHQNN